VKGIEILLVFLEGFSVSFCCLIVRLSQPVKISDELLLDARVISKLNERSIAGQVEFWAQLGRAIEPLLQGAHAMALKQTGKVNPISECLESVETAEGKKHVAEYLGGQPYPLL